MDSRVTFLRACMYGLIACLPPVIFLFYPCLQQGCPNMQRGDVMRFIAAPVAGVVIYWLVSLRRKKRAETRDRDVHPASTT